jgi:LmbE family N-acetylglucosaminyl deacetylase
VNSPVVVVSPHLDDAILSASSVLSTRPGSILVSAFSNGPPVVDPLPEWDQSSLTFAAGDDVIAARRNEDCGAASVLGATTVHLGHWDRHYRSATYGYDGPTDAAELADAIAADLLELAARTDARTWVIPLGVLHPDHQITAWAARQAARSLPEIRWLVYDDLPYSAESDADVAAATARVEAMGFALVATDTGDATGLDRDLKTRAIDCYVSQLAPLGSRIALSIESPEHIRRLVVLA